MNSKFNALTAVFIASLLYAGTISAQSADLSTDATAALARGNAAVKSEQWGLAVKHFGEAQKHAPHTPQVLYNLALAVDKAGGRELAALGWFKAYLASAPTAPNVELVRHRMLDLEIAVESAAMKMLAAVQKATLELPSNLDKSRFLQRIVLTQLAAGNIAEAVQTAQSIPDANGRALALNAIAIAQARVGDQAGAGRTASTMSDDGLRFHTYALIGSTRYLQLAGVPEPAKAQHTTERAERIDESVKFARSHLRVGLIADSRKFTKQLRKMGSADAIEAVLDGVRYRVLGLDQFRGLGGSGAEDWTTAEYFFAGLHRRTQRNLPGASGSRSRSTSCRISQTECARHPESIGTLDDNWQGSATDQESCLQRAVEVATNWCANRLQVRTVVSFLLNGKTVASRVAASHTTLASGCVITAEQCVAYPSAQGTYRIDLDGAGESSDRCLRRAHEFTEWCDNPEEATTVAEYFFNGVLQETKPTTPRRFKKSWRKTSCRIVQEMCIRHPEYAGTRTDDWEGADSNPTRCLERAREFPAWCDNPGFVRTTASFLVKDKVFASRTAMNLPSPVSGCVITQEECPAHPEVSRVFMDDYQGSGTNQARCLIRAAEFKDWCRTTIGVATRAEFFSDGILMGIQVAN